MKISILIIQATLLMLAASTLYSVSPDFKITNTASPNELAHATYSQSIYEKGWNYLHIYANDQVGLLEQHRGAGYLEGYL